MSHPRSARSDRPESGRAVAAAWLAGLDERWPGARRRAVGIAVALALEAGMILLLLTLGEKGPGSKRGEEALATFSVAPDEPPAPEPPQPTPKKPMPAAAQMRRTEAPALPIPVPTSTPPALIPLSKDTLASSDIAPQKPRAVIRPGDPIGPAAPSSPGDSQRIAGSGPHGEPLYAARWYTEPGPAELAGYLSTATSPGYALINCRTVPDFRVEDCVLVDEYPGGAGLGRAVLAAAWQFRVRPPRVGGRSLVGEWVRIRISYEQTGG
jgi:protein TonB